MSRGQAPDAAVGVRVYGAVMLAVRNSGRAVL